MTDRFDTDNPELEALFHRFQRAPNTHMFAPLADACRKAGMVEAALEICDKGIAENPGYTSGYVVKGKCLFDLGKLARAEETFEEVLEHDENNLVALKYLGLIMAEQGNANEAYDKFRHILALDPDDKEIKRRIADLESSEEPVELPDVKDEEFEGESISLSDDAPASDDLATTTLADIYAEQGYIDKAARIYREVLKQQPGNRAVRAKLERLEGGAVVAHMPADKHYEQAPGADEPALDATTELTEVAVEDAIEIDDRAEDPLQSFGEGNNPEEINSVELDEPVIADGGQTAPEVIALGVDEDTYEPPPTPPAKPKRKVKAKVSARASAGPTTSAPFDMDEANDRKSLDERQSYEQFKRWLRRMSD